MLLKGKRVLIVGMARSGIAAAELVMKRNGVPVCYDSKATDQLSTQAQELIDDNKLIHVDNSGVDRAAHECDMLVLSPGVPETLPFIVEAKAAGKPVLPEIELGYRFTRGTIISISGTNGKTTTTTLTGEIFKRAGERTFVLGNIGLPICDFATETKDGDIVVMETAAFQLNPITEFHPHVAAVLNVTPDHLERFGTIEAYAAAKENNFKNQTAEDFAVLNADDEFTATMAGRVRSQVLMFSRLHEVERGAYLRGDDIIFRDGGFDKYICAAADVAIPGAHNLENALAAVCMASCMGVPADVIRAELMEFAGVEHRIEFVCETDGVRYINDSKGTNPDAALKAVAAMTRPTVLIMGGYDKHADFLPMLRELVTSQVYAAVVLGATKQKITDAAAAAGFTDVYPVDTFEQAVQKSRELSQDGGAVLLSPACASWDMFDDYEQRGRVFKELVRKF